MGKLPEGWKRVRLGEVIKKIGDGGTPSRNDPQNFSGGIAWVVIEDIKPHIYETKETLSLKGLMSSSAKLWPKGSVIVSTGATIGEVGIAEVDLATKQGITGIVLDSNKSFNVFFRYLLLYNKKQLIRFAQGTSFEEIRPSTLIKIQIPLPPIPEQRKIAEILETVDNAIEKTDKIIEKYKRIKQGLMQDLLTKGVVENDELGIMNYELRDEKTHKFKDSPLGRIPEEWEVVELGKVFNIFAGGDISKINFYKEKTSKFMYPIFSNTLEHKGLYGYSDTYKYPANSITITGRGTLGYATPRFEPFNAIIRVLVLVPKQPLNVIFVSEYINSMITFEIESTGVPQLTAPKASVYKIPLPPLSEQRRIAEILSQIDETIEKEQKYKEKLERIKQGLMEDLLTGKVRVNHLIEGVENVSQTG